MRKRRLVEMMAGDQWRNNRMIRRRSDRRSKFMLQLSTARRVYTRQKALE